jgi:hypothetical protein
LQNMLGFLQQRMKELKKLYKKELRKRRIYYEKGKEV